MVKTSTKKGYMVLMAILHILMALIACGGGGEEEPVPLARPSIAIEDTPVVLDEPVVITIGNHTDLTGPSANIMTYLNKALGDLVGYYNEQNLIPGVELEVITYDGQFDPSRDIPGYEWLKERGADFIFTSQPSVAITVNPRLQEDQMVLFTLSPNGEEVDPSGYVFAPGTTFASYDCYTTLKWVAENALDFPADRPAKIGLAMWNEPYGIAALDAAKTYAKTHPDQYEWVDGFIADFTFTWGPEVEALKDCDYIIPPAPIYHFAKEYRDAGYTAKFIGTNIHAAVLGMGRDADMWNLLDGMLINRPNRWWNEDDEAINLARELLSENRHDEAEEIIRRGTGYLGVRPMCVMLELVADAVEAVGPKNFSSQAIYDAAKSFTLITDGVEMDSFSDTKRASLNYLGMYEIRADGQSLFRVEPEWIPVVYEP